MPIRTLQYLPLEFSVQLFKRNISSFTRLISVLLDLSVNSQELYAPNCFKLIIFTSSRNVLLRFIWNSENGISLYYYKGVRQEGGKNYDHINIILIEQFCSCYIEPHLSLTCLPSWTTRRAKLWTYLRPIGLEIIPAYFTKNFLFSAL